MVPQLCGGYWVIYLGKFAIGLRGEKLVRAAASKAPTIVLLQIPGAVSLSDMAMSKMSMDEEMF